jgi:hypothetical protein
MEYGAATGALEAYNILTGELLESRDYGLKGYYIQIDADGNRDHQKKKGHNPCLDPS